MRRMNGLSTLAVIPARYASTRLPGKPLLEIAGMPLVVRVLKQVQRCSSVDRVIVATDDERIRDVVLEQGGEVVMTPSDLPSGGDRVAFVARSISEADVVLNVQVDDPLVGPDMIDPLVEGLRREKAVRLAVLTKRIEKEEEVELSNIVKMVFDGQGKALYFSRSPIPYPRNPGAVYHKHIGPYAYRRDLLLEFSSWEPTPLEKVESLEMLRVLERGEQILCVPTERDTIEIDTPGDVEALERYFEEKGDDLL
jgi:3-deoxy-manno-octulosonate cytidylyltransferase (CMP-KDO synthetase)